MNILILVTMGPLCGFYLYVLVNFQRELRRAKRDEIPGAKTIPLCWRAGQLSTADPGNNSGVVESEFVPGTRMAGPPADGEREVGASAEHQAPQGTYEFESVYLGPFLLIPMRNGKGKGSQAQVTPITSARA
jgi:hypothetical protein